MEHYIAYHSVELMRRDYQPSEPVVFWSRKPKKALLGAIGARAWIVVGKRTTKRTRYDLVGAYSPKTITNGDDGSLVTGPGVQLQPPVEITDLPWFLELLREQKNFSLGLNRIRNPGVISGLESLMPEGALPIPSKSIGRLSRTCVYTIVTSDILAKYAVKQSPMTATEKKTWVTAEKLKAEADANGLAFPVLFADAKDCSKLLYWGVLTRLEISRAPSSTTYTVDKLRSIPGDKSPQDLKKLNGENILPDFIRPYALCQTPDFLTDVPGLPETLSTSPKRAAARAGRDREAAATRADAEQESSFSQSDVFPLIARLIMQIAKVQPDGYVTHDVLVERIVEDPNARPLIAHARQRSLLPDDRSVVSNMVAWFSQQISVGRSDWVSFFNRERIDGAWAYRPTVVATTGHMPDLEVSAIEGEPRMFFHMRRERDPSLVAAKRIAARNAAGQLECEICGFVARSNYPFFDVEICEVHHRRPLSEGPESVKTKLEDLAVLCPNCHRAIHQTKPMMSVESFREHIRVPNG